MRNLTVLGTAKIIMTTLILSGCQQTQDNYQRMFSKEIGLIFGVNSEHLEEK